MKESGLGWSASSWDDAGGTPRDIKNDLTSISWTTPRGIQDTTGLDKSARETLLLLADFSVTASGVFNDEADKSHAVFKTVSSTSVPRTVTNTVSGQTLAVEVNVTDYALTRAASGELTFSAPAVLQNGTAPTWS
ncbi:MAG TPA: hypothetical protein VF228_15990 [Iamia sp.]